MKRFVLVLVLLLSAIFLVSYDSVNNEAVDIPVTSESDTVYICIGPYAERYHSSDTCVGLDNCSSDIFAVTLKEAVDSGRTPCRYCYGFDYDD